jgi:hypothetical protein
MSEGRRIRGAETRLVPTNGGTRGLTPITIVRVPTGEGPANAGLTPIPARTVPTNRKKG